MPVSNFECQIARGQIGRYLSGGVLSPQAMRGLEEHLDECPSCKALVAEQRAALIGQLDGPVSTGQAPTHAVVSMPAHAAKSAPRENPLVAALRARSAPEEDEAPKTRAASAPRYAKPAAAAEPAVTVAKESKRSAPAVKPLLGKPLALTAVLAVVLIAMSYLTKGNGGQGALGGKAADAFAAQRFANGSSTVAATKPTLGAPEASPVEPGVTPPSLPKPDATSTEPMGMVAPSTPVPLPPGAKPAPLKTPTDAQPSEVASQPQAIKPQTTQPAVKPKAVATKPAAPKPATAKPASVVKPRPVAVRRSAPRPVVRRSAPPRKAAAPRPAAPAKKVAAVRVYGPDGKPINP